MLVHKGEILSQIIRLAPEGTHFAFEPIPALFENLKNNFPQVTLYPYALCNSKGESYFQWVKNAPAYSGLKRGPMRFKCRKLTKSELKLKDLIR